MTRLISFAFIVLLAILLIPKVKAAFMKKYGDLFDRIGCRAIFPKYYPLQEIKLLYKNREILWKSQTRLQIKLKRSGPFFPKPIFTDSYVGKYRFFGNFLYVIPKKEYLTTTSEKAKELLDDFVDKADLVENGTY